MTLSAWEVTLESPAVVVPGETVEVSYPVPYALCRASRYEMSDDVADGFAFRVEYRSPAADGDGLLAVVTETEGHSGSMECTMGGGGAYNIERRPEFPAKVYRDSAGFHAHIGAPDTLVVLVVRNTGEKPLAFKVRIAGVGTNETTGMFNPMSVARKVRNGFLDADRKAGRQQ